MCLYQWKRFFCCCFRMSSTGLTWLQRSWDVPVRCAQCTAWRILVIRTLVSFFRSCGSRSVSKDSSKAMRARCRYPLSWAFAFSKHSSSRMGALLLKCMFLHRESNILQLHRTHLEDNGEKLHKHTKSEKNIDSRWTKREDWMWAVVIIGLPDLGKDRGLVGTP